MANGDGTTTAAPATLPPPPAPAQTDQTDLPPKVGQSFMERAGGVLSTLMKNRGGDTSALDARLKQHYQQRYDEAKMHQQHMQTYATVLAKGVDPATGKPLTPEQVQQYENWYNTEKAAFTKSGGVDKDSKGLIQRGVGIVEHAIGKGRELQKQGQQGQGGLPAPPQPTQAQQPQTQAQSQLPPPPAAMIQQELASQTALSDYQKKSDIDTAAKIKEEQAKPSAFKTLQQRVKGTDLPAGTTTIDGKVPDPNEDYTLYATGNQAEPYVAGPSGQSAADSTTHTMNLMDPNGTPETVFREGDRVFKHGPNGERIPIEGTLIPYQRGMLTTESDREVMGMDANGNPERYILRTKRTPVIPGMNAPGSASSGGGAAAPASGAPKAKTGASGGTGSAASSGGRGQVFPTGVWNVLNKQATAVSEARNSLVGDNFPDSVGGLASDLKPIFTNPDSIKRVSQYLGLVNAQVENEGKNLTSQGAWSAAEWYVSLPQTVVNLQQGALRDASASLTPEEQAFVADYYRVMGTIGGMRASTGASAAEWSYNTLRSELPTPGPVTNYTEAARRLKNFVQETNVVSKRNKLITPVDTSRLDSEAAPKHGLPAPPAQNGARSLKDRIRAAAAAAQTR